jgi:hypothetical protein
MATLRQFLEGFAGASVAMVVAGSGKWAFSSLKADPELMMKARGLEFYDVAGSTLFPVYGDSGGLMADQVFYLVDRKNLRALGVQLGLMRVPDGDVIRHARAAVIDACRRWDKESQNINPNGGSLPKAIRFPYQERV